MACHACQHMAMHLGAAVEAMEESEDTGDVDAGWRIDERKRVGPRYSDGYMMDIMDDVCEQYIPPLALNECTHDGICEMIPVDKKTKVDLKRACARFVEDHEDELTAWARNPGAAHEASGILHVCRELHACSEKDRTIVAVFDTPKAKQD